MFYWFMYRLFHLKDFIKELRIRKMVRTRENFDGVFNREMWYLTNTFEGVRNKRPLVCPMCKHVLLLRKSIMGRSAELDYRNAVFDQYYKCSHCGWVTVFGIAVPNSYYERIKALRNHYGIWEVYAPEQDWKQLPETKKRLKELGYF